MMAKKNRKSSSNSFTHLGTVLLCLAYNQIPRYKNDHGMDKDSDPMLAAGNTEVIDIQAPLLTPADDEEQGKPSPPPEERVQMEGDARKHEKPTVWLDFLGKVNA